MPISHLLDNSIVWSLSRFPSRPSARPCHDATPLPDTPPLRIRLPEVPTDVHANQEYAAKTLRSTALAKKKPPVGVSSPQLFSWRGGYSDRCRRGSQRVHVLAHSRASSRSETCRPSARVEEVLTRTGQDRSFCSRFPGWTMVWFVVASGPVLLRLSRPFFRWLQPFRRGGPQGDLPFARRKRLGIAPLRFLANQVIACRAA